MLLTNTPHTREAISWRYIYDQGFWRCPVPGGRDYDRILLLLASAARNPNSHRRNGGSGDQPTCCCELHLKWGASSGSGKKGMDSTSSRGSESRSNRHGYWVAVKALNLSYHIMDIQY